MPLRLIILVIHTTGIYGSLSHSACYNVDSLELSVSRDIAQNNNIMVHCAFHALRLPIQIDGGPPWPKSAVEEMCGEMGCCGLTGTNHPL